MGQVLWQLYVRVMLALLDAGVKIKRPVSGIVMGLITDGDKYAVLQIFSEMKTILRHGLKVTGTVNGVTATQMDIKIDGLPYEILEQALQQATRTFAHSVKNVRGNARTTS